MTKVMGKKRTKAATGRCIIEAVTMIASATVISCSLSRCVKNIQVAVNAAAIPNPHKAPAILQQTWGSTKIARLPMAAEEKPRVMTRTAYKLLQAGGRFFPRQGKSIRPAVNAINAAYLNESGFA